MKTLISASKLARGAIFLAVLFVPRVGWAQPTDADRATARALAREGAAAQKNKDYALAAERFQHADAVVHAPTLLLGLARAQVGLGKLVEAQETYQRIVHEGATSSAPGPFVKAVEDAKHEMAALAPRIAWVRLEVRGPTSASVTIDEDLVSAAGLGTRRACNPGEHAVHASAEGFVPAHGTFRIAEGEEMKFALIMDPVAGAPGPQQDAAPEAQPQPPPPAAEPMSGRTKWAIASFGLGAAGLIAGGVAGVLVLNKHSALSDVCPGGHCTPAQSSDLDYYHSLATVATVAGIVGVAGVAAGATLLLSAPKHQLVTPYAGWLQAGIRGTFE